MLSPQRLSCWLVMSALIVASPVVSGRAEQNASGPAGAPATTAPAKIVGGSHDFDFEFGSWKVHIKRLVRPLSGSNNWVDLRGTSVVRKVWEGRANLGELEVDGPNNMHLEGMSLRVYNPQTRQWNIHWANAKDGAVGPAMVGGFSNGRGEFYNQETLDGVSIYVRFIFSDLTETSFKLEQAFSGDGGKTWEPNWIAVFEREKA